MKGPWILLGIGGVLLLLSGVVALVSMLLPALTNGKASPEEAMMGVIPGCCCSTLSLGMVIGGIIWLVIASSQNRQP